MDKDRLNQENEDVKADPQTAEETPQPEEEMDAGVPEEDLGEELSPEELDAEPAGEEAEPVARKWDKKKKKGGVPKRYRSL